MHRMTLSVLQWNVWIFEKKENLLAFIKEVNPDIVCMQELTIGSTFQDGANVIKFLSQELGYNQFHKAIPNLAPSEGVGDLANGILSRFPITANNWQWIQEPQDGGLNYDDQHRLYVEVEIEVNNVVIGIGTTHVSYAHKFHDSKRRKSEADNLLAIVNTKRSSFILTGDFNSSPNSYLVSGLQQHLMHAGPDFEVKTWTTKPFSYNGFEETELNWRLDYIFTTNDLEIVSSEVLATEYSDHLPILMKVNLIE
jgi:endonuclease/exonuclease/phosphatase family metal-dependent hydrolase